MQWFINWTTSRKLVVAFGLVASVSAIVGAVGYRSLIRSQQGEDSLYGSVAGPLARLTKMTKTYQQIRLAMRDTVFASSKAQAEQHANRIKDLTLELNQENDEFEKTTVDNTMRQAFSEFKLARAEFIPGRDHAVALRLQ